MKLDKRFPLQVAAIFIVGLAIALYVASAQGEEVSRAVVAGAILSTLNVLAGYLAIEVSFEKSHTTFLKAVLGGMGIRVGVMLVLIVAFVRLGGFHATGLVVSVLGFYVAYLVLELFYIQRKASHIAR